MDKISVIIPVYNTENFLEQCLGSVVNQTYKNLEILIVDDGSPDKSDAVYKRFALEDNRIKIIKQKNSGLSVARNTGLKFATGQWIHFIDSDDYLDLDYYEKMMNAARDINPDIIAGGVISQNSNLYNIQYKTKCVLFTKTEKFIQTNALKNCTVWRYIFKRDFLEKNNLKFAVGKIFEDILFTPNAVLMADCIVTVPNANYHYVFNKNSLLNKKYTKNHQAQYNYAESYLNDFIKKHNLEDVINRSKNTEVTTYKLIAFKIFKKIFFKDSNESKYYLFGVRILKTYKK